MKDAYGLTLWFRSHRFRNQLFFTMQHTSFLLISHLPLEVIQQTVNYSVQFW